MSKLYRMSIVLSAAPLIIGLSIFVLWYFTEAEFLLLAGVVVIYLGLSLVLIAAVLLILHLRHEVRKKVPARVLFKRGLLCVTVMIANFPVAIACISAAVFLMTRYTLTIENDSVFVVSEVVIKAPGVNKSIRPIGPGERIVCKFHFEDDGELAFSAKQNQHQIKGIIGGYVTHGFGGQAVLVIRNDGKYEVVQLEGD